MTAVAIAIVFACTPSGWCQSYQASPPMPAVQCAMVAPQIAVAFAKQRSELKVKGISCLSPEKAYDALMGREV